MLILDETSHLSGITDLSEIPADWCTSFSKKKIVYMKMDSSHPRERRMQNTVKHLR